MASAPIVPDLLSWMDLKDQGWSGILVGNGASRAVWDKFGYSSLIQKAQSNEIAHPLTTNDMLVFTGLGTQNFERVLAALSTTVLLAGRTDSRTTTFQIATRRFKMPWLKLCTRCMCLGLISPMKSALPFEQSY
jgi:hypothetical protein